MTPGIEAIAFLGMLILTVWIWDLWTGAWK